MMSATDEPYSTPGLSWLERICNWFREWINEEWEDGL